jgi:hypothetical protein
LDFNIITGLPSWYLLLCILAGVLASMLLYFRERKNEFPGWLRGVLGVLRFLIVSLTALLLLSPFIKITTRAIEKPIVVVAQDNSQSVVLGGDSLFYRNQYKAELQSMIAELKENYEIDLFSFGEEVYAEGSENFDTLEFREKYTDISSIAGMMDIRFVNRNVGALLIASDGIFNKGLNPRYHSSKIPYPIYTLALGDTSTRSDVYFKRVLYNKIAFEGNDFPVEAIVNASKLSGSSIAVSLSKGGKVIDSKQFAVDNESFSRTLRLKANADKPGMHHYVLRVSSNKEEVTRDNNRYDLFVDVLKSKKKIVILYHSPHPDVSALKEAINSNINYEVTDMAVNKFRGSFNEYSLVILHQLPSQYGRSDQLLDQVSRAGVPVMYVVGAQSQLRNFNRLNTGVEIEQYQNTSLNEALPLLNEGFSLFILTDRTKSLVSLLPPLNAPFVKYSLSNSAGVLFNQKIGSINSGDPLWVFNGEKDPKVALIAGTGLWRWRMRSWQETGEHTAFNELINKSVQFLSLSEDKRRFKVYAQGNIPENAAVEMSAELYNDSYEPYNEPEVNLVVRDEEGNNYNFLFNKSGNEYSLNAGNFDVGTYTYSATVNAGDEVLQDAGGFTVSPVIAEQLTLRADHELLRALAEDNKGEILFVENISDFPDMLRQREDIKPLVHAERKYVEFIDIIWVLACLVLLLGAEWFLRKWSGSY